MRKTVLITGASGGLGLEFARIYAREGFELVVVARSEGKLYKLKSELETQYDCHVWVLAQDLSQPDAAYEVFNYTLEKNITIDALVNNAGFGDFGNFWEVDAQRQTDLLQVNIMTLVQLTRYFLPGMVERHSGHVVNLGSIAGTYAYPGSNVYGASKGFVLQFSRGLRCDLHGTGVRVTDVEPGLLESEFSNVRFKGDESRFDTLYENAYPLRPEDIADTIWWVVSRPAHVNVSQVEVMPTTQSLASARVFKG